VTTRSGGTSCEKGFEILDKRRISLTIAEPRDLERHLVLVYRRRRFLGQIRAKIAGENILGFEIVTERVQDQHPLRLCSRRADDGANQQSN
jgi:hypothetical protein